MLKEKTDGLGPNVQMSFAVAGERHVVRRQKVSKTRRGV